MAAEDCEQKGVALMAMPKGDVEISFFHLTRAHRKAPLISEVVDKSVPRLMKAHPRMTVFDLQK